MANGAVIGDLLLVSDGGKEAEGIAVTSPLINHRLASFNQGIN